MKRTILLIAITSILSISSFGQSFEKGSLIGEAGVGLGIYRTELTTKDLTPNLTYKDTAGGVVYPVMLEYGVLDMLGVAGGIKYTNFIENNDSSNSGVRVNGFDVVVRPAFHFVRSKHVDMYAGVTLGGSFLKYKDVNNGSAEAKGFGPTFAGNLGIRFLFGTIGVAVNYSYNSYHYPNFTLSDANYSQSYDYKGKGGNFGLGLVVKIQ